jgi:RNA polymerase sigma factor (sigma-70 family)
MTSPSTDLANTNAEGCTATGSGAGHRSPAVLPPGFAGHSLELDLCPEVRAKTGSGEHEDTRRQEADWEAFYRAECPRLIRVLVLSFSEASASDAADAAQNAFIDLFRRWDEVRQPRAWVRTVAIRYMVRQRDRDQACLHRLSDVAYLGQWCTAGPAPPEIFAEEQIVLAALRQLPVRQRCVIALLYDGFNTREIADVLSISPAAVRQHLHRGRSRLKDMLSASSSASWEVS